MAMLLGGSIRFSTAALRSGEYPKSSSYPAHLINRGKVEKRTTSLTQGVGPARELLAEQTLAAIYAATVATTNPFSGKLTLMVEPRITDNRFYVFADPAVLPVLEYSYLSSAQGPQMASREGWDVLGMEFRVVLDFGCGAIDWRGAFLNPGA
jgi:hypothetical protein